MQGSSFKAQGLGIGCGSAVGEDEPMKDIRIKFIPVGEMRYPSTGDYFETDKTIEFRIALMPNEIHMAAVLLHEVAEFFDVRRRGVLLKDIDNFDMSHPELDEPGWDKAAPYAVSHALADAVERVFILGAGEFWPEYDEAVENLFKE